ncbi:MAG: hypothetical protein MZV70_45135 [Desulfobacterales bacterium]|nr:hypothetical protein [Desulfobacterales bacterium]
MTAFARHEPDRPFDASANAGGDHGIQVAECLQHLPHGQGCGMGRHIRAAVAYAGLPGARAQSRGA